MKIIAFIIVAFAVLTSHAQNQGKAFEINQKLGRGINYGNMFEAPAETAWGNPWQPEYARMVSELGFNHVRIPIRWEPEDRSSASPPYTIESTFLNRVKQVVDSALNNGLLAIINMHHHDVLYDDPDRQKARFLAQWKQISEFFKDYSDSLLFEILNEPHGNLTADKWNVFASDALQTIREDNPGRIVLIGTPEYGGLGGLQKLLLPDDENIILTIHYYNPFQFTHQGADWVGEDAYDWLGTKWQDTEEERNVMAREFAPLVTFSEQNHIPVHIGEFGAYSAADMASRAKWTTFLSRYFEQLNWSWAYWEFSAGFGIYNPVSKTYYPELVNALLHNSMPEPAKYEGTAIYSSNFQTTTDGWALSQQGTAVAALTNSDNSLQIDISNGSTETWHVQLVRNNMALQEGKKYRLSFKAQATSQRGFSAYIGKNVSPWTSYSGYNLLTATDSLQLFTIIFDMNETDNSARIVFDLGKSESGFTVTHVSLEEIVLTPVIQRESGKKDRLDIYPNPVTQNLVVNNCQNYEKFVLLDTSGKILMERQLVQNQNIINLGNIRPGLYFLQLSGKRNSYLEKIIKY
jgi:aryl-phospho-beta-D-glucosidase BglC (GH1 family)